MDSPLPWLDVCVIAFYLIGITWLGLSLGKKLQQGTDYFMPRRFGKGHVQHVNFKWFADRNVRRSHKK